MPRRRASRLSQDERPSADLKRLSSSAFLPSARYISAQSYGSLRRANCARARASAWSRTTCVRRDRTRRLGKGSGAQMNTTGECSGSVAQWYANDCHVGSFLTATNEPWPTVPHLWVASQPETCAHFAQQRPRQGRPRLVLARACCATWTNSTASYGVHVAHVLGIKSEPSGRAGQGL